MKQLTFIILALCLFTTHFAHSESTRIDDFALIDHQGGFHKLSQYGNRDAVVIFIQANGCELSHTALASLSDLEKSVSENSVQFLMLNASDTRDDIKIEAEQYQIPFPILVDEAQLVAESLSVKTSGEVLLIDPKTSQLIYHGPISGTISETMSTSSKAKANGNEINYLHDALVSHLAGQSAKLEAPAVKGKTIHYARLEQHRQKTPSYQNDIVPILQERCVACHQENGLAPWAMNSHQMIRGWAPMIRETVMTKRMPPGQIDTFNLEQFVDVHHITPEEQATLIHWIDAGAPNKGKNDPLAQLKPDTQTWRLGEPDLIVDVPAQEVPATGVVDYRYIPVELGLTENKWLRAYEFNVDQKPVLHHIIAFSEDKNNPGRKLLGGYGPGKEPRPLPDNTGVLLTPSTHFIMQIHYTTNGQATVDRSKLALYFSDEPPKYQFRNDNIVNFGFIIPPNEQDYATKAGITLKNDSYLYFFSPHMHFRGKRMDYTAVYPDGKEEWLINIPNYRFDWQMDYQLKEPKFLPAGTRIIAKGAFDNSEMNSFNPDPNQEVTWGEQTWQEMFIGFVGLADADGP